MRTCEEVILLAGGPGVRLQDVIRGIPKPMADINGKPFLWYVLSYLAKQGVNKIIMAIGYKHEIIKEYFKDRYDSIEIKYSIEKEPLGTGGAIKNALAIAEDRDIFVINGDTFFNIDLRTFYSFHRHKASNVTIALKLMKDFDRYGAVTINGENRLIGFEEKQFRSIGLINGGIYIIKTDIFNSIKFPDKFSFETDFLEKYYKERKIYAYIFDEYFIDIGIPEDYKGAKNDFKSFPHGFVNKEWTSC